ncbi:MAG: histidinol dehydrogenase [Candidatus Micrarchaeota archaeon]|nr:histidinol dehydrogenase [Candidatus Micrarchaeota archaeon]
MPLQKAAYPPAVWKSASAIIAKVRQDGDDAVSAFTKKFDGTTLEPADFEISSSRQQKAFRRIPVGLQKSLARAATRIRAFTDATRPDDKKWQDDFARFEWAWKPIGRVGCYVPGGKATYPSSALMTAVVAKALGCDVTVCTPPKPSDATLAACAIAGVDELFQVGGAQAIAAMAYGTETISAVDKIVGPGGMYVDAAKRICARDVAIDFPAGPSELLCIAGKNADARQVALDLVAQAEHDAAARAGVLALDEATLEKINEELGTIVSGASRKTIIQKSLSQNGFAQVVSMQTAAGVANALAFEHVALYGRAAALKEKITNAGVVYVDTPPALGDYTLGSSHVLPTGGFARSFGMLSAYDFLKPVVRVTREKTGLEKDAALIANSEGLFAHAASLETKLQGGTTGT